MLPKENTCVATHFRFNLACLRAGLSLGKAINWFNALKLVKIQAMRVIEFPPVRRSGARHTVQFADTGHDELRITARLTTAGNGKPTKVATSG